MTAYERYRALRADYAAPTEARVYAERHAIVKRERREVMLDNLITLLLLALVLAGIVLTGVMEAAMIAAGA